LHPQIPDFPIVVYLGQILSYPNKPNLLSEKYKTKSSSLNNLDVCTGDINADEELLQHILILVNAN